jgi:EAL domain-containing protein (putative c-di-GMP-specific phosphodiesterase class I)
MTSTSGETREHFRSSCSTSTVETREQFERLKSLGVNFAQGYLMGRPVPIDELERQPQVHRPRQDAA